MKNPADLLLKFRFTSVSFSLGIDNVSGISKILTLLLKSPIATADFGRDSICCDTKVKILPPRLSTKHGPSVRPRP